MDQNGIKLEPEVEEIIKHVQSGNNFLLSGGAGSGKTYSLVKVIGELLRKDPSAFIACITYTNTAVHEIESRVANERLVVSTIHDFLWRVIGTYQTELRQLLIDLMSGDDPEIKPGSTDVSPDMFDGKGIQYKNYTILREGIISHDEVIILARRIFQKYPKLCDITRDRFRYILVDEYQDTSPEVISILLDQLSHSKRRGVCGFFGDSMQAIYEDGVGDIQGYVSDEAVREVIKEQNRRNPRVIYEFANHLRTDGIRQRASDDLSAPNMIGEKVKEGQIRFYFSRNDVDCVQKVRDDTGWDFTDVSETKELNLTHNLIAPQAGFGDLMEIYDKDGVLKFKKRIVDYIKINGNLQDYAGLSFGEVVSLLQNGKTGSALRSVSPTAAMKAFIEANPELLANASAINFLEFNKLYVDKDQLIDDKKQSEEETNRKGSKRCDFIRHVFKIQSAAYLYEKRRFNEFLRKTEFRINCGQDKVHLKDCIESINAMSDRPISEVIDFAHENRLCIKDDRFNQFRTKKEYLFNRVNNVKYSSFRNLYHYLEGMTTYSTQHKIKGREFNRVLIILDSGGWNEYNFNYLFENNGTESVLRRTGKLFYVCCTRAKESLAIYFRNPSPVAIEQAKIWFGNDNVREI